MKFILNFLSIIILCSYANAQRAIVVVNGNSNWVDTGFTFNGNTTGFVFASGYVIRKANYSMSFDNYATPSGRSFSDFPANSLPCQTCGATSLIGKLGINGTPFIVGERAYINGSGRLYLTINDTPLTDNYGAFVAVIYKSIPEIGGVISGYSNLQPPFYLINPEKEVNFSFFSNPVGEKIGVELNNFSDETLIGPLKIFNVEGELVMKETEVFEKSSFEEIDVSSLSKGNYLLTLNINGENKSKKLIIN